MKPFRQTPFREHRRLRLLVAGEACSLAHVGRSARLARWAAEAGHEVHYACGPDLADVARGEGLVPLPLFSVPKERIAERIAAGTFFYTAAELLQYLAADRGLLERLAPDLVVTDLRLSMHTAAQLSPVPHLALVNAHWSPASRARLAAPRGGFFRNFGPLGREILFAPLRPWALRIFPAPLHRLRIHSGLPPCRGLREYYCAGTFCAYLDMPELNPLPTVPPGHFYLGPVVWEPATPAGTLKDWPLEPPLCYVTMGSSGDLTLLPRVLEAAGRENFSIVLSGVDEGTLDSFRRSIPGLERRLAGSRCLDPNPVLRRAALTICHGGSGTVYQSLSHGVPVLCLPANPDQGLVAAGVQAAGVGWALAPEAATLQRLSAGIERTLRNSAAARQFGAVLRMWNTQARWLAWLEAFGARRGIQAIPQTVLPAVDNRPAIARNC